MNTLSNPQMLVTMLAVTVSLAVTLPFVQAEDIPARGPIPFSSYDTDANGSISETEFNATRAKRVETVMVK
jgi:hypothetical protein